MPNSESFRQPFQHADKVFRILSLFYDKNHVHALLLLFSSFRDIDDQIDTALNNDTKFNELVDATEQLVQDSFTIDADHYSSLPETLIGAEQSFVQALSLLETSQKEKLRSGALPKIINSWKLDKDIATYPFSQTEENLKTRHAAVILPFLDMAAICLYNTSLSDEDFYVLAEISSAWAKFDWLEDLKDDLPESVVHMSTAQLNDLEIYSLEDLWNITPVQFNALKKIVIEEFQQHLQDILKVKSWPLLLKITLYLFFTTRMISCWKLPYPALSKNT